ncbi:hypothetical protein AJ79_03055 [Helicocarpus griseus UAMH5409]|uniref:Heterokaryon incompatibility domain-containing protein n=1 Tax=Helicocarpus griseus UAMH5409 TaxID=1447875 RepID=A0A2B7Y0M2_9EURO|nr:hypothetical protein AJ79_03055 [Helicocarpus griseus UAMH5409]
MGGQCPGADEKAYSDGIRINCSVPRLGASDTTERPQFLTFFFQRHEEPQPDLINRYPWWGHPALIPTANSAQPYTGRNRPPVADFNLFKEWKRMCQKVHGTKCSQIFKGTQKVKPRVVDVNRRCLTFANEEDQWTCLSYVWGKANTLRLTKSNVQVFSVPDSLGPSVLPNIIEDALQVTKGLGERYLWVDSLCIIQDDDVDKTEFISQMDSIYTLATVVIVSSTCVDANSCLPGVRPGSRSQGKEPFKIRHVALVRSLDPVFGVKFDLRTGRAAGYLGETIWDTRAWTLQERFLASRSLVFTAEQVFWECEEAFWCEDSFREILNLSPDPHRTSLCGGELNLTDGLNAFRGIIRAFERSMGEEFFWGMPAAFLESALAWGHRSHTLRRRRGVQILNASSENVDEFPSWSWVGWTSDGQTRLANQNLTTEGLGLRFYRFSEDGKTIFELKQAATFNREIDLLVEGSNIADHPSKTYKVSLQDLPVNSLTNLSSLLCFCTASASLTAISWNIGDDSITDNLEIALSQGPNSIIQLSWSHIAPSLKQGDKVEVIAVARNRGSWDSGHIDNGAIGAMVISWDANGNTAIRKGFAWMEIREWRALANRQWKLIILK